MRWGENDGESEEDGVKRTSGSRRQEGSAAAAASAIKIEKIKGPSLPGGRLSFEGGAGTRQRRRARDQGGGTKKGMVIMRDAGRVEDGRLSVARTRDALFEAFSATFWRLARV